MARSILLPHISEGAMQAAIKEAALRNGWLYHHAADSRRADPGLPDVLAVRGEVLLALELKRQSGRVKPAQAEWIAALERVRWVVPAIVRPEPRSDSELSYDQALDLLREGR